ncbi:urease [Fusarium graminearum PH-1]|uniref:urease n=1 Tax=Gibberella zeae (strain ATCC MYA-4620 / CBS 123657 / FGSC 9075 / NRRL 31084 / PH-1) TaxID=229533 RepID=UPI00021F16E9|nr:urease [Fusarium graminearum PH-1]ESU17370.1 urease [Fusarium graminearum PH-1]|eukprot:XP_011319632.1 urease [Fusarium graminearum PH-1]
MHYTPREVEKLAFSHAGYLAQKRLAHGRKLNHLESSALISNVLQEMQVEGTFETGTHLITIHNPISTDEGDLKMAFYGSFIPVPSAELFPSVNEADFHPLAMPGAIEPAEAEDIILNAGRDRVIITVTNKGTRAVHVGSHFHFMDTNPDLNFDREKAYGYHLDLPAGEFLRFEPNEPKSVTLVQIGGSKVIQGGSGLAKGPVNRHNAQNILQQLQQAGYQHSLEASEEQSLIRPCSISRKAYASAYGPTTGDLIRLGSTDLWAKVEKDYTFYGDECTLGCGKTIRDGMGAASGCADADCLDLAIVNAVIIDWTGIFKADIGIKDGIIVGIGKAGNPSVMDGVSDNMVIGSNTDIIDAGGKIVTAGGVDTHVHNICPQQAFEAISSGITTLFGGGTGPSTSSTAVNGTASKKYIRQMMQACDQLPVNFGLVGKGSDSEKIGLLDQINAGVIALKLHEDFGCTPSTIENCLNVCEEQDIQCHIHTDGLNEAGFLEHTAAIFKGRSIHVYHVEGAGGGHAPDVIKLVAYPNVLPSSTSPTMPFTTNTIEEHIDMAANCHRLSKDNPDDASFLKNRIREETISAEDILHDIGAISIMSSDSQAMGRSAEVLVCTWQAAHKNKLQRGALAEDKDTGADNFRIKRYISKYTINPAITQGISHTVGSVETGKLADLVIWDPAEFGTKPFQVLKKGFITYAQMGDPNGAVMFVSQASASQGGDVHSYNLKKQIEVVKNCRTVKKSDLKFNSATPNVDVDPETLAVTCDGMALKSEPTPCTFEGRSRRTTRQSKTTSVSSSAHSPVVHHTSHDDTLGLDNSFGVSDEQHSDRPTIFVATPPVFTPETEIPYDHAQTLSSVATTTQLQFSRSVDDIQGQSSTLLGSSSEADPWLLRHCRFDDYGLRSFYGLQFRNIGGVPNRQKIPVHFIVTPKLTNDATLDKMMSLRSRLNGLISVSMGIRLAKLADIWNIVHESLQQQLRTPDLSVLTAGLMCLHATMNHRFATTTDTFKWTWLGTLVGIAQNLGLHLETRMCAIPAEEKQMRARLWWALYIEDSWLSLLMGRPPYISDDEWDVGELDDTDFAIPTSIPCTNVGHAEITRPFRDMARLSVIAHSVQSSLYSLKASQKLSENLSLSIQTAQPIFEQLSSWRASVQVPEASRTSNNGMLNDNESYPAAILIAHATLVTHSEPPSVFIGMGYEPLKSS